MNRDAIIPSMFHRRLLLLTVTLVLVILVLVGQLYRLTVVQGARHLVEAERVLVTSELLPTVRGRILDRNGRVLAADQSCFDLAVDYRLIDGRWVNNQAAREARQTYHDEWDDLGREERAKRIDAFRGRYEGQVEQIWHNIAEIGQIPVEEVMARVEKIQTRVEKIAQSVWRRWAKEDSAQYNTIVTIDDVRRDIREQRQPHVILRELLPESEATCLRLSREGPMIDSRTSGITVIASGKRNNPWKTVEVELDRSSLPGPLRNMVPQMVKVRHVGRQLLGGLRSQVYAKELAARPMRDSSGRVTDLGGYLPGDRIGNRGIEVALESHLRGKRGRIVYHLDTEAQERIDPEIGQDVQLTVDIRLQSRVQALLSPEFGLTRLQSWHGQETELPIGTPLNTAAVVLDVKTGEILALVSSPTEVDGALQKLKARDRKKGIVGEGTWPAEYIYPLSFNRATQFQFPPGSIVKPLMLAAAISNGKWSTGRHVECNGHFFEEDPEHYRCWIYREWFSMATHGDLSPIQAIAKSCNIYFYTIGFEHGLNWQTETYKKWGLVDDFDLGIGARSGVLTTNTGVKELIMRGIGQGELGWTPLHAANAFAMLARYGEQRDPVLIRSDPRDVQKSERGDFNLSPAAVDIALEGLYEVVNNQAYGGARRIDVNPPHREWEPIFNTQSVIVRGKTGTAQQSWPRTVIQYRPDGTMILDQDGLPLRRKRAAGIGAHSWFVGLVGRDRGGADASPPEYAIAVVMEWGGSGSRGAGPIANQIIQALQAEGYLP